MTLGLKIASARAHLADGVDQLLGQVALEHVAARAHLQRLIDALAVGIHGKHDHPGLGVAQDDLARRIDAVHLRHDDVEERDVGTQLARQADRLTAVAGGSDDFEVALRGEEVAYAVGYYSMVVGDEDPEGHGSPVF